VREVFPSSHWPGDDPGNQLEFALKYDGLHLGILALLFQKVDLKELADYIRSKLKAYYTAKPRKCADSIPSVLPRPMPSHTQLSHFRCR